MQLRKLYRTIESIAHQEYENEEDLLKHVLREIVQNEEINLKGGRTWKFDQKTGTYLLLDQVGKIDAIRANYRIKVKDYPIFLELPQVRTIIASENGRYLRR